MEYLGLTYLGAEKFQIDSLDRISGGKTDKENAKQMGKISTRFS